MPRINKMYRTWEKRDKKDVLEGKDGWEPSRTETFGYIDKKTQIENMMLAGEKMRAARDAQYQNMMENRIIPDKDLEIEPMNVRGADIVDVANAARKLGKKKAQAEKEKEDALNEKRRVDAEEARKKMADELRQEIAAEYQAERDTK
jgi:hypothetical protein